MKMEESAMKKISKRDNQHSDIAFNIDGDSALMCQVAEGSTHAFRMIVEKWQKPLMNYFFRSCNNAHSSEDMAQLTFVNLYKARQSYANYINEDSDKPRAKFSTYLFSIARNVLISEHRKSSRRPADVSDPFEMECRDESTQTHSDIGELEEIFYNAVENLPENQRTAILLLKQQELSYEEIADIMKANLQSIKTWIHRARLSLRDALEKANNPQSRTSK